ncbi:GNAT family N-acetyltransferase [Amycolatopsis saalfeldensis]|uniref:Acetyltransferase (GNAT) family protein n=1 Tax=Amycolatopsis saalfeldensis TaxID=394193 RepID=A0A1H8YAI1_9PSEU|nr:GNAT family N-acetyltransferase [Amycolatopsis saalfeldensis]SEP49011.1 Acetyltransferase (GNAT) family protein [Amycolatopsis saalfeldensis]
MIEPTHDRQAVSDVLTEAFTDDPVASWLFPDATERGRLQSSFYRQLLDSAAAEAYLLGRGEGAAVWLSLAAGQALQEDAPSPVFGENGERLAILGRALAERHPRREPHLYLSCMGVARGRQGAGLGSLLLRHGLARADAVGLAVYLEASSPRSRALYLRHGFTDLGEPVRVADSPPLWPMTRANHEPHQGESR